MVNTRSGGQGPENTYNLILLPFDEEQNTLEETYQGYQLPIPKTNLRKGADMLNEQTPTMDVLDGTEVLPRAESPHR